MDESIDIVDKDVSRDADRECIVCGKIVKTHNGRGVAIQECPSCTGTLITKGAFDSVPKPKPKAKVMSESKVKKE